MSTRNRLILAVALSFAVSQSIGQLSQEQQKNWDAQMYSLERFYESERNAAERQGGGGTSSIAPAIILAVIGGALLEWSRQPRAQRPVVDYVQVTKRHRQNLVHVRCKNTHQATLIYPRYEKPNSHALIRIFQSDRAAEYKAALARYETALGEAEPACKCVADRSVSEAGFSEQEWSRIAADARTDRPWMALEEPRARQVFEACSDYSPSDIKLSWLYAGIAR